MSLIADALKAAQQEKQSRNAAPQQPRPASYLSLRASNNRKAPVNKSVLIGAGALAGVLIIGTVVAITMLKAPGAPEVHDIPNKVVQPPQVPDPAQTAVADSVVADTTAVITPADAAADANYGTDANYGMRKEPKQRVATAKPAQQNDQDATDVIDDPAPPPPPPPRVTSRSGSKPLTITLEPPKTGSHSDAFQQAANAQQRGDLTTARQLYIEALSANPNNPEIYNNLGTVYRALGNVAEAEDSYRNAIRVNSDFAPAWSNLGVMLAAAGRKQEAISALQQAIKLEPSNAGTRVNLAVQYLSAKLYSDARRLLEESIQLNPGLAEAHYALGQTLEAQGDRMGAIKSYNSFLGLAGSRFSGLQEQVRKHLAQLEDQVGQ